MNGLYNPFAYLKNTNEYAVDQTGNQEILKAGACF